MLIREVEKPRLRDFFGRGANDSGCDVPSGKIFFVGSGKGALSLVLRYLIEKKNIINKLDEVMVADWIGFWVYNQIQPYAFPAKRFSERTRAILVYHQYGFPQDMDVIVDFARDKKLVIVEDCAHALASTYKGKPVGSFGDFSIYSFSKWFFCFALGGVQAKSDDFYPFSEKLMSRAPLGVTFVKDVIKLLYEWSSFTGSDRLKRCATLLLAMSYSLYGHALKPGRMAKNMVSNKIGREIMVRKRRYSYFRSEVDHLGLCDHLEAEGVVPYVIPVRCPEGKAEKLVNSLISSGVDTGLYNFDINRNLLSPRFVRCVWIPCHSGITDGKFQDMINIILKTV